MSYQHPEKDVRAALLRACPTLLESWDATGQFAAEFLERQPQTHLSDAVILLPAKLLFKQVLDDFYAIMQVAIVGRYGAAATIASSMQEKVWGILYYSTTLDLAQKWLTHSANRETPEPWKSVMRKVVNNPDVDVADADTVIKSESAIYTFLCMVKHGNPQAMHGGLNIENELKSHIYYYPVADTQTMYISARTIYLANRYLMNAITFFSYHINGLTLIEEWGERIRKLALLNRKFHTEYNALVSAPATDSA